MRAVASVSARTCPAVCPASATAACASRAEPSTWRPISATEAPSSSAATATVSTLEAASSAAAATAVDCAAVCVAVAVMAWAVPRSSPEAAATVAMTPVIAVSKPWISSFSDAARRIRRSSSASLSPRSRSRSIALSRKTRTARAIAPTSSRRPASGTARSVRPSERPVIAARRRSIGRTTERTIRSETPPRTSRMTRPATARRSTWATIIARRSLTYSLTPM
ncbi:hypothetical protein MPEAHAMD_5180 [Methylobacterium frigidaeris]|uniref:Uncharacterized protein n=1 Tax=Methylobacterium frigidaeris TaxID=2038277 RepID=A0AA37HFU0_9HYPH|nr:hypothetical protein MPEAHAMD_5180 [Methylobacterium frigidaeris]